jgi:hypothetical protein
MDWENMPVMPLWELARRPDGTIDLVKYGEIKKGIKAATEAAARVSD